MSESVSQETQISYANLPLSVNYHINMTISKKALSFTTLTVWNNILFAAHFSSKHEPFTSHS